jgi:glycerophosphoryl diester phosphodiesterase
MKHFLPTHPILFVVFITTILFIASCQPTEKQQDTDPNPQNSSNSESAIEPIQFIDIPSPDFQGHRGARGLLPENTIPSFLKALELGMNTIELDLVLTADSVLLVSHEPWFNHQISSHPDGTPVTETESRLLNIFKMSAAEAQTFDVGSRGNPGFPEQMPEPAIKPTLKESVLAIENWGQTQNSPQVWYNIELKSDPHDYDVYYPQPETYSKLLLDELSQLDILNRSVVQSFDPNILIELRKLNPNVRLAILVGGSDPFETHLNRLGFTPQIYSPHYSLVDVTLIEKVRAKGMTIVPWTINTTEEMQRLLDLGVDGIITDYPNRVPKTE